MNLSKRAAAAVLTGVLAVAGAPATAQQQAANAAPTVTASQAQARAILMRMAEYLSALPKFSVNVRSGYDVVQASGERIEFGERRTVLLNRPNQLRVDTERSDGKRTMGVFTGREIVLVDFTSNVYATEPQPDGLDESILHFVSDLGMRLPLALLLMSRLPVEFERRVRSIDYVEKTSIFGAPVHHLAARGDTVDFQVWVSDSDQPLPVRVVITYKNELGQPAYRAQFLDWNLTPDITEATFRPQLPPGARKVLFASQLAAVHAGRQGGKR